MTALRMVLLAFAGMLVMGCANTEQAPAPGGEPEMEERDPQQQPAPGGQQQPGGGDGGYQQPGGM